MEEKQECVVKFQSKERKITMYFSEDGDGLEMQMTMDPEETDQEPDLALKLASIFLQVLNTDEPNEPEKPIIYS
jgi:hypothetical protein